MLVEHFSQVDDERPKLAPTTIGKTLNAIQALIGYAYSERWIETDDVHNIPVAGHRPFQRRPFTAEEVRRLFAFPLFTRD